MATGTALPILSHHAQQQEQNGPEGDTDGGGGGGGGGGAATPTSRPVGDRPRRKIISAACESCRKKKTRCNGVRPVCSACVSRGSQCVYDVEAGETRVQSLKSKNQTLENSLNTFVEACCQLQSDKQDEVDAAVRYIRNDPHFRATMEASMRSLRRDSTASEDTRTPLDDRRVPSLVHESFDETASPAARGPNIGTSSARRVSITHAGSLVELPEQHMALMAITNFYTCSGKLFHSFPRDLGLAVWREVYSGGQHNSPVKLAQMFSIVAIGCQYAHDADSNALGVKSYHVAKSFLENALEDDSLQATRVIACLAMFNIMNKSTVALSYIEQGLGIFSRYGFDQPGRPLRVDRETWTDMKRVWRTHVFLESWLTSTLGYVSASGANRYSDDVLADMHLHRDPTASEPFSETVQAEMAKVSVLTARVARALYATTTTDMKTVEAVSGDLHAWFANIHVDLRPESLSKMDLHAETTIPVYFVHLIYHGAVMLIHRRVMFDAAERKDVLSVIAGSGVDQQATTSYQNEGLDAARSSAQIIKLMLDAQVIHKRCWLVLSHSFTAAIIIMNSCAQKLLARWADPQIRDDIELVYYCIRQLAFAADLDAVAEQFYLTAAPLYDFLVHAIADPSLLPLAAKAFPGLHRSELGSYPQPSDLPSAAQTLIDLVRNPFGDLGQSRLDETDPLLRPSQSPLPLISIKPATITSHPTAVPRPPSRRSTVPVLDARVPKGFEPPKPKSYLFSGGMRYDVGSPYHWPHMIHTHDAPHGHTQRSNRDDSAPPPEEPGPTETLRTSAINHILNNDTIPTSYPPSQATQRLGWSASREVHARPFSSHASDSAPFGTRNLLQVDHVPSWASKKRRYDLDMDSQHGGGSDSRRPSGGDSGYASASRGYGSISSVGGRGSISMMSEGRRESAFSEPARRESVLSDDRRESIMSQGRRESMLPPTRRRESWFVEALETSQEGR